MFTIAVARSSSDVNAIRYVLPVIRTTSPFSHNEASGLESKTALLFVEFAGWQHRERSCCLRLLIIVLFLRCAQRVDLHIYIVPPELWQDHLHSAVNQVIPETISAGFIR